jgi:hypothetical protein
VLYTLRKDSALPLRIAANPFIQNDGYPNFLEIQDFGVDKENARD